MLGTVTSSFPHWNWNFSSIFSIHQAISWIRLWATSSLFRVQAVKHWCAEQFWNILYKPGEWLLEKPATSLFLQPHSLKIITSLFTWENVFNSYFSVELPFSATTAVKKHYQSKLHYFLFALNLSPVPVTNLQASAALQLMNQGRNFFLNCDLVT